MLRFSLRTLPVFAAMQVTGGAGTHDPHALFRPSADCTAGLLVTGAFDLLLLGGLLILTGMGGGFVALPLITWLGQRRG